MRGDPWANWQSKQNNGKKATGGGAASGSAHAEPADSGHFHDSRVTSLIARMDTLEDQHSSLEHKVEHISGSVENIGTSMTQQFSQVMQAIANLAATRSTAESNKRPAPSEAAGS